MRTLLTLVRKDFAVFLRNPAAVVLTFVVPIALPFLQDSSFSWSISL